jgi:hypothetical protein
VTEKVVDGRFTATAALRFATAAASSGTRVSR